MISKHRSRKTPPSAVSASLVNIQNPESLLNDNLAVVRSLRPMNKTVESLLVQLVSDSADERECACTMVTNLAGQSTQEFLTSDLFQALVKLLSDSTARVRLAALGALRNISVDGGDTGCEMMVKEGVMVAIVNLLKKPMPDVQTDTVEIDARSLTVQALHIMNNICEKCDDAVKIVIDFDVVELLFPLLVTTHDDNEIRLLVANSLFTLVENNDNLARKLSEEGRLSALCSLLATPHSTCEQLLIRTLTCGILECLSFNREIDIERKQELVVMATDLVSSILDFRISDKLDDMASSLSHLSIKSVGSSTENENLLEIQDRTLEQRSVELNHALHAQEVVTQIIANTCDDGCDDEDWEDCEDNMSDDSASSSGDARDCPMVTDCPDNSKTERLSSHWLTLDIVKKIFSLVRLEDASVYTKLQSHRLGKTLENSLDRLLKVVLICSNNLIESRDIGEVGGAELLESLWDRLSELILVPKVANDLDLISEVMNTMRSVISKLASVDSPKVLDAGEADFGFLFETGKKSSHAGIRSSCVRIVSSIGCSLAKHCPSSPVLKSIALFLCDVASLDVELWVSAEALDSIFDVFAEDDTDAIVADVRLVDQLRALVPTLKSKMKQQRKSLGEHLPVVSTVRSNLSHFIQYKSSRIDVLLRRE